MGLLTCAVQCHVAMVKMPIVQLEPKLKSKLCPVPPLWSGFPDFGPDPDFFVQSGPGLVQILAQKSGFFIKSWN